LKAQNLITGKEINALTKYRDDLESLNEKLKKGIEPRDKELSDLHLLFK
jgi:hypothetical protein